MFNNSFFYLFGAEQRNMEMQSLNVGCGSDPWGDVRVDIALCFITKRFDPTVLTGTQYLAFKDGNFKGVKAIHVLEHQKIPQGL